MPQKPLKPGKKIEKKQVASNRHGKQPKMKKGKFDIAPKKAHLKAQYNDQKELTRVINQVNESNIAGKATQTGGTLAIVKAAPPVMATAEQKQKLKKSGRSAPDERPQAMQH